MNSFRQDLRYAVRMLLKKPAFTMLAVLTLTLGISASVAIFSILDGFFLRRYPARITKILSWWLCGKVIGISKARFLIQIFWTTKRIRTHSARWPAMSIP